VELLVPERFHAVHPGHRGGYFSDPRTRPMGAKLELFGRRKDGKLLIFSRRDVVRPQVLDLNAVLSELDRQTTNVELDEEDDAPPGLYVRMAVSDTGVGMAPETVPRVRAVLQHEAARPGHRARADDGLRHRRRGGRPDHALLGAGHRHDGEGPPAVFAC
jgi:hypothetical protein